MKNILSVSFISSLLFLACSKKEAVNMEPVEEIKTHYDTTAIDSFSSGAVSVDIARQIRMSSQQYQDSVKNALKAQQEEQRIREEIEKENKKKQEEEKKKNGEEKEQKASETSSANAGKTE